MSRSTRSATVSNVPLIDCSIVPEKLDTRRKSNISVGVKSTTVDLRNFGSSKPTVSKDVSTKILTREIITTRSRNIGATKHSDEESNNRGTLPRKTTSNQIVSSIGEKSLRNTIKVEPSCNETVTSPVRNRSKIAKTNKIIDKLSSNVAENTGRGLGVASRPPFRLYASLGDVNNLGLFNPLNFSTVCAIDSVNFGFACQSCRMVRFKTYSELRVHEDWCGRTVRDDKFYKCRTCERKYHSQIVLSRHEKECKQESQVEKRESGNPFDFTTIFAPDFRDFPFFCTSCHVVAFRTLDEMRIHENWCGMVLLGTRDSVMCDNCGMGFRNTTVLTGHREGPPGCTRKIGGRQKRNASPLRMPGISGSMDSKRRKLNQSVTASKVKKKFTVVLCSKRKSISQKSVAKMMTMSSAMKVEQSSLDSSIECSPRDERKTMQEAEKQLPSIFTQKSNPASQSGNNEFAISEDMIMESAISAADQASFLPGYQDTEKKSCPVCDVTIVGSIDDMCVHFQQFHNLALGADVRYSSRPMSIRMGPTNCLDCNTLFDTRLEMTRHKQVCTKKIVQKSSILRFICAICARVSESRDEFNMHVQTSHGGVDDYQKILFGKTKTRPYCRPTPGESSLPSECVSESTNEQCLLNEIKPEIVDETNQSPVVNSGVLGVIVPLKLPSRDRTVDISSANEVRQKSDSHVSNEKTNINQVAIKKSMGEKNDLVVNESDNQSLCGSLSKSVLEETSIAASGAGSNNNTVISDLLMAAKASLRVEDMVASVAVNSSLCTKGSEGCVGKIRDDVNPADLQPNPSQEGTKKQSNPQLPVVFNIPALEKIFLKNGRRRLRLQTSLLPGSEIVVVGTEVNTSRTLTIKSPANNNSLTNDKKLHENIEQNKLVKTGAKPANVVDTMKMISTEVLNQSAEIKCNSLANITATAPPPPGIDQDDEQKRLLLALQLVPSSSLHSAQSKDDTPVVRKSKRQMAKQIDSAEKTVEMRAMEMTSCKNLNPVMPKLKRDIKAKNSSESELVNTSSSACTTVKGSVTPGLSAHSISSLKFRECDSRGELNEAEQQNLQIVDSLSLGNHDEIRQSSSEETSSLTLLSRSEERIEGQSEAVISTTLLDHPDECPAVQSELLSNTLVHSKNEDLLKGSESLSTDVLARPTKRVSDQCEPKSSVRSDLIPAKKVTSVYSELIPAKKTMKVDSELIPAKKITSVDSELISTKKVTSVDSESIPAKKATRRNLRILEPIDDETLKCLECGSILCTAIEIVSHACPD